MATCWRVQLGGQVRSAQGACDHQSRRPRWERLEAGTRHRHRAVPAAGCIGGPGRAGRAAPLPAALPTDACARGVARAGVDGAVLLW